MQGLVKDMLYISQDEMQISVGDSEYGGGSVPGARSKLEVDQLLG